MPDRNWLTVHLSDCHTGSPYALGPLSWELPDGGTYLANDLQKVIHEHWLSSWRKIAELRKRKRLAIFRVGDPIEGCHHGSVQVITQRVDVQERMHVAVMREALDIAGFNPKRGDILVDVSGTPAHGGEGATTEERIARQLLDVQELDGQVVYRRHLAKIGGCLFDLRHLGDKAGAREWTKYNTARAKLESYYLGCLRRGVQPARYIIGGHWHEPLHVRLEDDNGAPLVDSFTLPSWKLRDDYIRTIRPDALSTIGLLIIQPECAKWEWSRLCVEQDEVTDYDECGK